jgi:glycosyltransferase involved in cell wall biosynthesis
MIAYSRRGHKLRIAIDCRISDFHQGIGTAIQALAKAFSESAIDDQEYTFIVHEKMHHHLAPFTWGPCSVTSFPTPPPPRLKMVMQAMPMLRPLRESFRRYSTGVPVSDGNVERCSFDLVHFPTQIAYRTSLPSIYQPHDLQHLHFPQYFAKGEFLQRDVWYRVFCEQAAYVCVQTEWTKADLVKSYNLPPDKIAVIPWGVAIDPGTSTSTTATSVVDKYKLPQTFFFYPAVTWPHKNHLIILNALKILRDEKGLRPTLVCTGSITEFHKTLEQAAKGNGLTQQVRYLGFIPAEDLQGLYEAASAMVYPSRFEGFGLPILEAYQAGTPVLCSGSSVLPEVAQDGALYFDPDDPAELSSLMLRILESPQTRRDLMQAGLQVVSQYSFEATAKHFQSLYRQCERLTKSRPSTLSCSKESESLCADNHG